MRLWAYGTSPHGLGVHSGEFWLLSPREFYALRDVQQADANRWAMSQAIVVNMNLGSGEEPFIAEDFLGTGNRAVRKAEREMSRREAVRANRELEEKIKPGVAADGLDIPDWARI